MGSIAGLINGIIQPSGTEYRSNTASAAFINFQFSSDRTIGHIRVYTEISVKNWFNNATITLYNSAG
jgi:hypothetical protein